MLSRRAHAAITRSISTVASRYAIEKLEDRLLLALVAAYSFDELSGAALDASGNNNSGTLFEATRTTAGKYNGAVNFDGVNDWVTVNDSASLDLNSNLTLEAWVRPSLLTSWRTAILKEATAQLSYGIYAHDNNPYPGGYVNVGNEDRLVPGNSPLTANTWSHLALTYNGSAMLLYVNGVQVGSKTQTGPITTSNGPLRMGGNAVWGEFFAGQIDEVRVYNNALTPAQIQTDMNTPIGTVQPPPGDTTPPLVTSTSPINNAVDHVTSFNLTATFNEPMLASSFSSTNFELRTSANVLVASVVTYDPATRTATLNPNANLTANATYTARVRGGSTGVKDAAGNALASDHSWTFTTARAFTESVAFSGLIQPTVIRFSPDGRVFVAEKRGVIRVFPNISSTTSTVFADLRTQVFNNWDRGLLGFALHPNFPATPSVYVLYTYDGDIGGTAPKWGTANTDTDPLPNPPGATDRGVLVSGRLSRLTVSGNTVTGETVLINDWAQQFPSHSIGSIQFGPDGALYASGGDGASFNYVDYGQTGNPFGDPGGPAGSNLTAPTGEGGALRAQDLLSTADATTLDGSIIRIDPNTGAALSGNPLFTTGNDNNAKRIIADGLRNPFRIAFRPGTSELWVGDVGWNEWEEINRITTPTPSQYVNFGWPAFEGAGVQSGYQGANLNLLAPLYSNPSRVTAPHYTYRHSEMVVPGSGEPTGGSSISGLAFYQGGNYPSGYQNALFFSDYSRNRIYVMFKDANGVPDPSTRQLLMPSASGPVNLEIGPGGDVFYCDLNTSTVRRVQYFGANRPPVAVATATPSSGASPLNVQFSAAQSSDPDPGNTLSYAWDLDSDGQYDDSTLINPTAVYTTTGSRTIGLRVTDNLNASSTTTVVVTVNNSPPVATINSPLATLQWKVGDTVNFSGGATDPEQGNLPASALSWKLTLQHGSPGSSHSHDLATFNGVATGSFVTPDHGYPSYLELTLTATDAGGLTSSVTRRLDPQTVTLVLNTSPTGLQVTANGATGTAPFSTTVIANSANSISVASPQTLGATTYQFANWSDGLAQSHNVTVPAAGSTLTATFNPVTTPPPSTGLVASYNFNEGAGTTLIDRSGNNNTGTVFQAAWSASGRNGGALSFDGANDWVTVNHSSSLNLTNRVTLEAWVRPTALSGWRTIVMKETTNTFSYAMDANDDDPRPAGYVRVGGIDRAAVGSSPLALNTWTHLATTYNGSTLLLYVNGVQAGSVAVSGNLQSSTGVLRLGGNSVWGEYFAGLMDDVRIYNRALTAAEINTDMNGGVSRPESSVAAMPFSNAPLALTKDDPDDEPLKSVVDSLI